MSLLAVIGLALMALGAGATCGNQTGGSCLTGTCSAWRNAVCQWPQCVCPADLCATNSTNGECIPAENQPAAPGSARCEDLKVGQYWGPSVAWRADQTIKRTSPFLVPFGITCAHLSTEEAPAHVSGFLGQSANLVQNMRSFGVQVGSFIMSPPSPCSFSNTQPVLFATFFLLEFWYAVS